MVHYVSLPAKPAEEPIYSLPPDSYPSSNPGCAKHLPLIIYISLYCSVNFTADPHKIPPLHHPQLQLRSSDRVVHQGRQRRAAARGGKRRRDICGRSSAKQSRLRTGDEGGRPDHAGGVKRRSTHGGRTLFAFRLLSDR